MFWLGWRYRQQAGSHRYLVWWLGFGIGLEVFGAFLYLGQSKWLSGYGGMDQGICSVELPTVLMLLPTSNACYISAIDKPSGH
jgi:hypothetical protein